MNSHPDSTAELRNREGKIFGAWHNGQFGQDAGDIKTFQGAATHKIFTNNRDYAMTIGRRIHMFRKMQKLTLEELSKKSQLSVGYLSKLERSDRVPPLATIQTLAATLKVSVNELLEEYKPNRRVLHEDNDITIVKKQPEITPDVIEEGYALVQLTRNYMNRYMSPFMLNIPPGTTAEFRHDAEEFNYVVCGPIKLRYKGNLYCLDEGDSFYFDSRHPHVFINDGERQALVLSVVYIYRKF